MRKNEQIINERIREVLDNLVEKQITGRGGSGSMSNALAQLNQLYKEKYLEMLPKEKNNTTNLDLTTNASLDWQFYYEDKGYNNAIAEMKERMER